MVAVYADDDDFADPDDDEDVAHKCCSVLPRFMNVIMMMEDRGTGYDDDGSNDDDGGNDDDDDKDGDGDDDDGDDDDEGDKDDDGVFTIGVQFCQVCQFGFDPSSSCRRTHCEVFSFSQPTPQNKKYHDFFLQNKDFLN